MTVRLEPEDLFPLSDALQMELEISATSDCVNGRLYKTRVVAPGLGINTKLVVTSSKVVYSKDRRHVLGIATILEVKGDLHLFAYTNRKAGALAFILFDESKFPVSPKSYFEVKAPKLVDALKLIREAAVAEFRRNDYDEKWEKVPIGGAS